MTLRCRFYEKHYPDMEEVVKVTVTNIESMGAYVQLLEYNEIEGMIMMSEISRRRIRSINKLIRVGRSEHVVVIRVDPDKGYIDLSKRRVNAEDAAICDDKYNKGKAVNQILRHTSQILGYTTNEEFEALYQQTAWYFDRKANHKAGAAYDMFKRIVTNPEILKECQLEPNVEEVLIEEIKKRLMPQPVKIRADFDISCFAYEGIESIKQALRSGLEHSSDDIPIKIHLIAPPSFSMITQTPNMSEGIAKLQEALKSVGDKITALGGKYELVIAPKAVSAKEEDDHRKLLEELELKNREMSGDSSSDEDDENSEGDGVGSGAGEESDDV